MDNTNGSLDKNVFSKEDAALQYMVKPLHQRHYLVDGEIRQWEGPLCDVYSAPVFWDYAQTKLSQKLLGSYPMMDEKTSMQALDAAVRAYGKGSERGKWPTLSVEERIEHVEEFARKMNENRTPIVNYLMWEIGKSYPDSCKEFDRTVAYIKDTVDALKEMDRTAAGFQKKEGVYAQIRRAPLGVNLCMGPYNYPLNETFTTLIPSVIMGNTVVVKPAKYGVLLNEPLLKAYQESFPKGVINTIYGDGGTIITPLMTSGKVDVLAFIGSERVSNMIIKNHPRPAHLETILGLNAKNPGIVLSDADMETAVNASVAGSLSYNGQRCTALKLLFVHEDKVDEFVEKFSSKVDSLKKGMPWTNGAMITPLPDLNMVNWMNNYVTDAVSKGAKIVNKGGDSMGTLFNPAVLFPVAPNMKIYQEEQFGPVVPIVPFKDLKDPIEYMINSDFGQQASIFGNDPKQVGQLIDIAANQVCRINLNGQCMRGPDAYPFTGRKSSAKKVLSITDALRAFSIRSMVAWNDTAENKDLVKKILDGGHSNFLSTDYLF